MRYKTIALILGVSLTLGLNASEANQTKSQVTTPTKKEDTQKSSFSKQQLETALAPIALYPDALLAQMLMASTFPNQIQEALKWSKEHPKLKGEEAVKAVKDKKWDGSVISLVAFPEVLEMMGNNLKWTKELGEMFLADPDGVMDTIQSLRKKAKEKGNLKSTKEQKVETKTVTTQSNSQKTVIEIHPTNPEKVYIPVYNPTVVYGPWWYPSHPPYYYHPPHITPVGAIIGFTAFVAVVHCLWSRWDWGRHDIHINVNRYNQIVNRRVDIKKQQLSWRKDLVERGGLKERVKNLTPEQKSNLKDRMQNLDDDKKAQLRDNAKDKLQEKAKNLTPEQKSNLKDRMQNLDEDKKAQLRDNAKDKLQEKAKNLTPEQKSNLKDRMQNLDDDKKAQLRDNAKSRLQERGKVDLDKAKTQIQKNPEKIKQQIDRAKVNTPKISKDAVKSRAKNLTPSQKANIKSRVQTNRASRPTPRANPRVNLPAPKINRSVSPRVNRPINRPAMNRPVSRPAMNRPISRPAGAIRR